MKPFEILTTEQLLARLEKWTYKQLHIHHTWRPNHAGFTGKNHLTLQEGMCNYHTRTNGWSDIGQHVTLMPDGSWVTGRDFGKTPASISGWNTGAFAVEMLGDFDTGRDKLEGKQKDSILALARYFAGRFGDVSIKFHREGPSVTKTCPGSGIDKAKFMQEVQKVSEAGKVFADVAPGRWSEDDLAYLKKIGVIKGDAAGKFNPDKPISREEAAVLIARAIKYIKEDK